MITSLLAQSSQAYNYTYTTTTSSGAGASAAFVGFFTLIYIAFIVLIIVAMWKIFTKAGRPGWASIIPFYNTYTLVTIAGKPGWWFLLYFIPVVNIVISLLVAIGIARAFGKSETFGVVAVWLFSVVGYLMLGLGKATYQGVSGASSGSTPPSTPATPPAAPPAETPPAPASTPPAAPKPPMVQ